MTEIKWIKIATSMFDDEKIRLIEAMPEGDAVLNIWIKLLCLSGKCNAGGFIMLTENIPYTEEMLVTLLNKPANVVKLALSIFFKLEMLENMNGRMLICKWDKHQNSDKLEEIREHQRNRVRNFRERKAIEAAQCNVTETLPSRYCNAKEVRNKKEDISISFDQFYQAYPKKVGRAVALKSWEKLHPDFHLTALILERLEKHKKLDQWKDQKYIPNPATWLNQRRWEDEIQPPKDDWMSQ